MNRNSPLHNIGLKTSCLSNSKSSTSIKPRNNHHYNISYQNYHFNHLDHSPLNLDHQPKSTSPNGKDYDYLLKFLLVGDSDVGKEEILNGLETENSIESQFNSSTPDVKHSSTTILLDGKRVKIQLWNDALQWKKCTLNGLYENGPIIRTSCRCAIGDFASGQGRFSTIIRSYSRGAQGILLVYDITSRWSFASLDKWLQEIEQHSPGIPMVLIGNRLHLAFRREVNAYTAENFAYKKNMSYYEISALCNFNIRESFVELSRIVLKRHGMENNWKNNSVLSLQEICCRTIVSHNSVYSIDSLVLPESLKECLKSYMSLSSSYHPKDKRYIHSFKFSHSRNTNCVNQASFKKKAKSLLNSMFKLRGP